MTKYIILLNYNYELTIRIIKCIILFIRVNGYNFLFYGFIIILLNRTTTKLIILAILMFQNIVNIFIICRYLP